MNENAGFRPSAGPTILSRAAGISFQEVSSIGKLSLKENPFQIQDSLNTVTDLAEFIKIGTAKPIAFYNDPFFGRFPAITQNEYGKGTVLYEGCLVSDSLQSALLASLAMKAGLKPAHHDVVFKTGINDLGKAVRFYFNYSVLPKTVTLEEAGTNLLTKSKLEKNASVRIEPWDVLIVEN
jgi:beta-galactosidase